MEYLKYILISVGVTIWIIAVAGVTIIAVRRNYIDEPRIRNIAPPAPPGTKSVFKWELVEDKLVCEGFTMQYTKNKLRFILLSPEGFYIADSDNLDNLRYEAERRIKEHKEFVKY